MLPVNVDITQAYSCDFQHVNIDTEQNKQIERQHYVRSALGKKKKKYTQKKREQQADSPHLSFYTLLFTHA